jgi:Spy/CpxP family protein refolding chaperone
MKTAKFLLGLTFILSLSFNAAFIIHLFTAQPAHTETLPNQMQLDLSEQQKKQIEPLRLKMHRDNEAIKTEIRQCQEKLMAALKTVPPDKQAIYRCIDNINNLQKKIQQNTVEEIIQVSKFMNPNQCNCLIQGLGAAMHQDVQPCNCPYCQALQEKDKEKKL